MEIRVRSQPAAVAQLTHQESTSEAHNFTWLVKPRIQSFQSPAVASGGEGRRSGFSLAETFT